MHRITFRSTEPVDHVCRALDVARKMGFELSRLVVEPTVDRAHTVFMLLFPRETAAIATLQARIASFIGTANVEHEFECGVEHDATKA